VLLKVREDMVVEARCRRETPTNVEESSSLSNYKHKLFLGFLKILPMVMAGLYLLNTILSYFDLDLTIFSYLTGVGVIPWLFILVASYLFRFCEYHRMFLWYIMVNNILCWIDEEYGLPVSDRGFFVLHIIVAGIFLFLVLYFHQKCRKHKT
jgi:hypothetical protein